MSPPSFIEVDHGTGMATFVGDERVRVLRDSPNEIARWAPIPDLTSILSADPCVLYRCGDLAIPLTIAEYAGLIGGDLTPAEIGKLTLVFGPAWEWGETFYATDSLQPLQAQGLRARIEALAARRSA
jgi:hypothetical protein